MKGKRSTGKKRGSKSPEGKYLLDRFTQYDLATWGRLSSALEEYTLHFFYHLEGQRQIHKAELCCALSGTETISIDAERWTREVDFKYADRPLSPRGSLKRIGGRFNIGEDLASFPAFPALYVGEDQDTVHKERIGTPRAANGLTAEELALQKESGYAFVNLKVKLGVVFNLTKLANLKNFAATIARFSLTPEIKGLAKEVGEKPFLVRNAEALRKTILDVNWNLNPTQYDIPSNSQVFGRLLRDAGFSGVLYPSMRASGKRCLAVFVDNLRDEDYVELSDKPHEGVTHTRISQENWKIVSEA